MPGRGAPRGGRGLCCITEICHRPFWGRRCRYRRRPPQTRPPWLLIWSCPGRASTCNAFTTADCYVSRPADASAALPALGWRPVGPAQGRRACLPHSAAQPLPCSCLPSTRHYLQGPRGRNSDRMLGCGRGRARGKGSGRQALLAHVRLGQANACNIIQGQQRQGYTSQCSLKFCIKHTAYARSGQFVMCVRRLGPAQQQGWCHRLPTVGRMAAGGSKGSLGPDGARGSHGVGWSCGSSRGGLRRCVTWRLGRGAARAPPRRGR